MPREADFNVAEHSHEDDAWFDGATSLSPMQRDKRARVLLAFGLVALVLLGIVLGAFSSNAPAPGPDLERLRARVKAAGEPTPLGAGGDTALLNALDHLAAVMPPPAPAPVADVVAADAAGDANAAGDVTVAAAEVDGGPTVAAADIKEPKPKLEVRPKESKVGEPKIAEPKVAEPTAPDNKFGIPTLEPKKLGDPKLDAGKTPDAKTTEPKVEDPKLKGPVDQALADAKTHLDAGHWAEAKVGYEKVLAMSAGNPRALLGRGRALLELRQVQPALKDIMAVLDAEPKNPTALLLAGSISQELGQKDHARGFYQRYLDAWPSGRKAAEVKALLERL